MREFAEQEIRLPTGQFAGLKFRCERQPFSRLFLDAVDSGRWRRFVGTGPHQTGKSLLNWVIPTLYYLFEYRESVICALPSLDMTADKWSDDLLPIIADSEYRDLLPRAGAGSRGRKSNVTRIDFANGATLRFMTGGGGDKSRAGKTTRILVITETDGMDESSEGSRESDKISQLEGRTRHYANYARVFMECTVSTEAGRTWHEYTTGTQSRVVIRCVHCRHWVTPEREHLIGWKEAASIIEAAAKATFVCPDCGAPWSEQDRVAANRDCLLAHRGQEVTPEGQIVGEPPQTNTLGFRWTAANNLLTTTAEIAGEEWKASHDPDEDNAERGMRQFWWALPSRPQKTDARRLDAFAIMRRTIPKLARGHCPIGTTFITVGCDIGKRLCHWVALAWRPRSTPHAIDYGRIEVPSDIMGEEDAILSALRDWRDDTVKKGWDRDGVPTAPTFNFIDAGNWQDAIIRFAQESGDGFFATKSYGATQRRQNGGYKRATGTKVIEAYDNYALIGLAAGDELIEVNADHWKSWLQSRVATPVEQPGAMTLFDAGDHLSLAKHLTSEKQVEEFVPGKGNVVRWEQVNTNNHYLDAAMLACVAGHAAGARLLDEDVESETSKPKGAEQNPQAGWMNSWKGRY